VYRFGFLHVLIPTTTCVTKSWLQFGFRDFLVHVAQHECLVSSNRVPLHSQLKGVFGIFRATLPQWGLQVMLPSACSFIVEVSCHCFTLHVSAYMTIFRCCEADPFKTMRVITSYMVMESPVLWFTSPRSQLKAKVLDTCFHAHISLDLFVVPKNGGGTFLRNVHWLSTDYTVLYPRA
jgi:hypothetical protein